MYMYHSVLYCTVPYRTVLYCTVLYCRGILSSVSSDPRVVSLSGRAGLAHTLDTMVDQLNRCQKALNEFLEVHVHVYMHTLVYMHVCMYIEQCHMFTFLCQIDQLHLRTCIKLFGNVYL